MSSFPTQFLDFVLATRTLKITPPEAIINEATKRTYLVGEMLRGRNNTETFKGGSKLADFIQVSDNNSFRTYRPTETQTPVAVDTMKKIEIPWRFTSANWSWTDEEAELNFGDPDKYFDHVKRYEAGCVTSIVNGMENLLWAAPNNAQMEAEAGSEPYSIPTFVTELDNATPTGFSTIMGLNPTTTTQWQNQREGYTKANLETQNSTTGLFATFDKLMRKVQFKKLNWAMAAKYWEDNNMRRMKIVTNGNGQDIYKRVLRASNDRLITPQDPNYGDPSYAGYPVEYIEQLDTAAVYSGTLGASHTSGVANTDYPRYYFLNLEYLFPIFHTVKYFEKSAPKDGGANQPNMHVQYIWTWFNLWCASRRRHGIVYPSA
jgi:hypothetical protein